MLTHTNYSRTILYIKKKSASCQYAIDKMQIYIYQRFLFYQCSKYHIVSPKTLTTGTKHISGKCNQQPILYDHGRYRSIPNKNVFTHQQVTLQPSFQELHQ